MYSFLQLVSLLRNVRTSRRIVRMRQFLAVSSALLQQSKIPREQLPIPM
jgi:hypothetical protein